MGFGLGAALSVLIALAGLPSLVVAVLIIGAGATVSRSPTYVAGCLAGIGAGFAILFVRAIVSCAVSDAGRGSCTVEGPIGVIVIPVALFAVSTLTAVYQVRRTKHR